METNNGNSINNRAALRALTQEYKRLQEEMLEGFRVQLLNDNYFLWEVGIFGPPDTLYAGGYFRAELCFPHDYPFSPPTMSFVTKIWHPNIYKNGKVCISILQSANNSDNDEYAAERWNPTQNVRTILLSVISLLNEPNIMSPANGIAAFWYRRHCETSGTETRYRDTVLKLVSDSKEYALEMGIKLPVTREEYCVKNQPESVNGESEYDETTFFVVENDSDEEQDEAEMNVDIEVTEEENVEEEEVNLEDDEMNLEIKLTVQEELNVQKETGDSEPDQKKIKM